MNCPICRQWLFESDDELDPRRRDELHAHLVACAGCQDYRSRTLATLAHLDALPEPPVHIRAPAVLAESLERTDRSRRRWRRGAALAAAASLLLAAWAATRIECELRPGAITLSWAPGRQRPIDEALLDGEARAELARLNEIAGLLAAELEDQDHRYRRDLALLMGQIRQLQSAQRADIALLERDFRALYAATQTSYIPRPGEQP